jgi:hypothetical protein
MEFAETSMELAAGKLEDSAPRPGGLGKRSADPKAYARSKVSNSRDELPNVDGRSLIARRFRDIARSILIDHQGGEGVSEVRLQLIRRFSAAACLAEQLESKLAAGEEINITEHALLCSSLVRIAQRIGINRVPKDAGPTLGDVLAAGIERDRHAG